MGFETDRDEYQMRSPTEQVPPPKSKLSPKYIRSTKSHVLRPNHVFRKIAD